MHFIEVLVPLAFGVALIAFPKLFTKAMGEDFERAKLKLKRIGFLLFAAAGLYCVVLIVESFADSKTADAKPKMEMHRVQAQTPDGSGWYLAESTHGAFSVSIPIPFNDFTITEEKKEGTVRTYSVGAKSEEGVKFSATRIPLTNQKSVDLENVPLDFAKQGDKLADVEKAPYGGWPAISFSVLGSDSGAYIRHIKLTNSLIMLILEYPLAYQAQAERMKSRFMASLKIKALEPIPNAVTR